MTSCVTTPTSLLPCSPFRRISPLHPSRLLTSPFPRPCISQRGFSCHVALTSDASSSDTSEEEAEMAAKVGKKVRVKVPLKVYHVMKIPDLDLCGMEGVIKQYVGLWKGKRITANFPFKVEFFIPVDAQDKPVKVLAHLREDEFEYVE
ncbi:ferredoxin-thioredoxin reductase, variable chain-like protein [Carex littledalei]|uniref:Ferredoxin-thioredoxin reductase, variable chain-like protein n=1 Tax=Carex littledalei TaxID=544730 RepID=A0A833QPB6_9POAL|nr:ferredoxin-thioredoxin reductase, variable chain-like protein [Carex littledalei]